MQSLLAEANEAWERGDWEAAETAIAAGLRAEREAGVQADLQRLRAMMITRRGAPLRAYELLGTEAAALAPRAPRAATLMLVDATWYAIEGGEVREAIRAVDRLLATPTDRDLVPMLELARGVARLFAGEPETGRREMISALDRLAIHSPDTGWESIRRAAAALFWLEEYAQARGLLETALAQARASGARTPMPTLLDTLAVIDFRCGYLSRADARSAEALRLARELDIKPQIASCLTTLAAVAAVRGDAETCREYTREALTLEQAIEPVESWARTALAMLALSQGDAAGAIAQLEPLADGPIDATLAPWGRELVEAYVHVGRNDDACALAAKVADGLERSDRPGLRALAAHCRGVVADARLVEDHFEEALRWHAKTPTPFARARTELAYGARLRRLRRAPDARSQLQLALATLEQLGARLWAERARHELGSRSPRGRAPSLQSLTSHELAVAVLVGGGATNKEAAAHLYVSPKTIDYHLASIYRKLEIRSRTELARVMARGGR